MMSKKILCLLIVLTMPMSFAACAGSNDAEEVAASEPDELEEVFEEEEPLTEEDLDGILEGVEDHYVLQDAVDVDYMHGVTYDTIVEIPANTDKTAENSDEESTSDQKATKVIHKITVDESNVDAKTPGTYKVQYTVQVNRKAYDAYKETAKDAEKDQMDETDENAADNAITGKASDADEETEAKKTEEVKEADTESAEKNTDTNEANADMEHDAANEESDVDEDDLEEVIIEKDVEIVDKEKAEELVEAGEEVWTDESKDYGEVLEEEKKAEENKHNDNSDKAETTTETQASANADNADKNESSGSTGSSGLSGSSGSNGNSGSSGSSGSSGNSGSTGGSGSSNSTGKDSSSSTKETHTHSYTGTVTKAATCGSSGTKTYKCSCGASYTESIPATGNHKWVEQTSSKQVWVEDSPAHGAYKCLTCGFTTRSESELMDDLKSHGGGSYTCVHIAAEGHYETQTTVTGYKCSVCGATK